MKLTKFNFCNSCLNACLSSCGQGKSFWLKLDGVARAPQVYFKLKYFKKVDIKTNITKTRLFEKQLSKLPDHTRQKVSLGVFLVESQGIWEVAAFAKKLGLSV